MKKQLKNNFILAILGIVSLQAQANTDLTKTDRKGNVTVVKSLRKKINLSDITALSAVNEKFAGSPTSFYFMTEIEKENYLFTVEKVGQMLQSTKKSKYETLVKELAYNAAIYKTIWNGQKLALENNEVAELPQNIETYTSL